jgi:hypothetical protein
VKYTVARARKRALRVLNYQLDDLVKYPSTPHTEENQERILSTLNILHLLEGLQNGNQEDQVADS